MDNLDNLDKPDKLHAWATFTAEEGNMAWQYQVFHVGPQPTVITNLSRNHTLVLYLHYAQDTAALRRSREWEHIHRYQTPVPFAELVAIYHTVLRLRKIQDPGYTFQMTERATQWTRQLTLAHLQAT